MENVVDKPVVISHVTAPYADSAISLFLASVTGMRYRTLNCMECGSEFLERNNDTMYRINDQTLPSEVTINGSSVKAQCGNCKQWYGVQVSLSVALEQGGIPLHLQPQSVYITTDTVKRLRLLHCLECGRPFHSISDRITQVVDNRVPFEFVNPDRIGPLEALCQSYNCQQTWALML